MNKLLNRQINKHFGKPEDIPEIFSSILKVINESYEHFEKDRKMLERAVDLSSNEMIVLNSKLRKETDELKKTSHELNRIFNTIDETIFSVDMIKFKLTHISAACEKIYGYTPEEFYSISDLWQNIIYPDDMHIAYAHIESQNRETPISNQYRIIHKNKSIRWIENKVIPTIDENLKLIRLDGVTSDITEKKLTEIALHENEAQIQAIFNAVLDAIIIINDKDKIVMWDAKAEALFGWKASEVVGKSLTETIIPPHFHEAHNAGFGHFMKTKSGPILGKTIEVRALNKNNTEFDISLSVSASVIQNKFQFIGFVRDISERKKSERETVTLLENLQAKNKDLRQFAHIVSHNLRAPIAKILGLTALFDCELEDKEFNRGILENVIKEAVSLDSVVKDMNTIITSRDSGTEIRERIVFKNELKLITKILEKEIRESDASITTDLTEPIDIVTVKSYFYSILYNLVSNAIKYRSHKTPLRIHIQTRQDDKFVYLLVKDNGSGIDLERNKEKIFGLYKRFHNGDIPGKGIGLNLVKTQTESLGGHVEVESKLNCGTTFKIFLPK